MNKKTKCFVMLVSLISIVLFEAITNAEVPDFVSFVPESTVSAIGESIHFSLTIRDADGFGDLTCVRIVIKDGTGTGTTADAIVIEYRRGYDRIFLWDQSEGRWDWATLNTSENLENDLCSINMSQSSLQGDGNLLAVNLSITPKFAFISQPFGSNKRVWLLIRDSEGNTLNNLEIGSWEIFAGSAYTLTMGVDSPDRGFTIPATGQYTYSEGEVVVISAVAALGFRFTDWTGDVYDQNSVTTTVTIDSDKVITANFEPVPTYTLTISVDSNENGTTDPISGQHVYSEGEEVIVSAVAALGYRFTHWTGDVYDSNSATTTVMMESDKIIVANFEAIPTHTLTMEVDSSDKGVVDPGVGQHTYSEGEVVVINAVAATGYRFSHWTGDVYDPNSATTTLMMDSDKVVTANFEEALYSPEPRFVSLIPDNASSSVGEPINFTLTVADDDGYEDFGYVKLAFKEGRDTGTTPDSIILQYWGINGRIYMWNHVENAWNWAVPGSPVILEDNLCSFDASQSWVEGNGEYLTVNFNITPKAGFVEAPYNHTKRIWLRTKEPDYPEGYVIPNDEVGAWTVLPGTSYSLTMDSYPLDGGSTIPEGGEYLFGEGDSVDISAVANPGYRFTHWSGNVENPNLPDTTVIMDSDKVVVANFEEVPIYRLSVMVDSAERGTTLPIPGESLYTEGDIVTVSAMANVGFRFVSWTGDVEDPNSAVTWVIMDADKTITANFEVVPTYSLLMNLGSPGGTTFPPPGEHIFSEGSIVTISATANVGYRFVNWTGDVEDSNSAVTTIIMDSDQVVAANFEESGFSSEPAFISLTPNDVSSFIGEPVSLSLEVGDGDGSDDITIVRIVIKEGLDTGTSPDAIVIEYRGDNRIFVWDNLESKWVWAFAESAAILENNKCFIDMSQSRISQEGEILIIDLDITPKADFIAYPFENRKRIWLLLRDSAGNTVNNLEIGAWNLLE